jgi:hypothetical protein
MALGVACMCAFLGALVVSVGASKVAFMPAALIVTFLAGIASTLYFLPRTRVIRRFSFATLVSHEIGSRRGQDKTRIGNFATRFLTGEMWRMKDCSSPRPAPTQFARADVRYYH